MKKDGSRKLMWDFGKQLDAVAEIKEYGNSRGKLDMNMVEFLYRSIPENYLDDAGAQYRYEPTGANPKLHPTNNKNTGTVREKDTGISVVTLKEDSVDRTISGNSAEEGVGVIPSGFPPYINLQ